MIEKDNSIDRKSKIPEECSLTNLIASDDIEDIGQNVQEDDMNSMSQISVDDLSELSENNEVDLDSIKFYT